MRAIPLMAVLVLGPVLVQAQAGRGPSSDQDLVNGTWRWASGDAFAVLGTVGPALEFADGKATVLNSQGDREKTGRFELRPAANPPEIDFTLLDLAPNRKWERKAAYEVTEKSLKLCFHKEPMTVPTCRTAAMVLEFRR